MNEIMTQGAIEMEKTREKKAVVLGRLRDFELGNPDGIPSTYANATDEELQRIAEQDCESLIEPDDLICTSCIDGRTCIHNADESAPRTRLSRVGGSASNLGVALNAESSVVDTFSIDSSLGAKIELVDDVVGYRSAHLGGCGGANGEIPDNQLINQHPAILAATRSLMEVPQVKEYFGVGYDENLAERVRENAGKTAEFLISNSWDGQAYVEGVKNEYPENVEDLEVDESDHEFHGHKEPNLLIIIGDKAAPLNYKGFAWNLAASKAVAEKLAGQRGQEGYQQVLIAEVAKHMAVCHRLPHPDMPIFLVAA